MIDTPGQIQIVSDAEAEEADFVVCMPSGWPSPFSDNETGNCHDCGREVQFRPHAPKKPPRLCIHCVVDREGGGRA